MRNYYIYKWHIFFYILFRYPLFIKDIPYATYLMNTFYTMIFVNECNKVRLAKCDAWPTGNLCYESCANFLIALYKKRNADVIPTRLILRFFFSGLFRLQSAQFQCGTLITLSFNGKACCAIFFYFNMASLKESKKKTG